MREEKKRVIGLEERSRIENGLAEIMHPDEHNGYDGYIVRSLYFDTDDEKDFFEKLDGIELRRKIRLRVYDPKNDWAFLEIKQKEGGYQKKRSLRLSRESALELISGRYGPLLGMGDPLADELYSIMVMQQYRPRCIVEYDRTAYIEYENNTRITFDSRIRATETSYDVFSENLPLYAVFPKDHTILEVKYNGFLLSYVKDLLEYTSQDEGSVSKYALARSISMEWL